MVDRNHGYVPTPLTHSELRPICKVLVGDPARGKTQMAPVALAQADELNRNGKYWWWAQMEPGSDEKPEHWSRFDGWHVRVGLSLRTWNERSTNSWKGRDEIRKRGEWTLTFNDQPVYGGGVYDYAEVLLGIRRRVDQLIELPIDWRQDVDYRTLIEGRKVYYRDTPATLGHWMPDQGCVMIHALEGHRFPPLAYDIDHRTGTDENPEYNYSDEFAEAAKEDILSPNLWWWREREDFG